MSPSELMSPSPIEQALLKGKPNTHKRKAALKRFNNPRAINMKDDAEVVKSISLNILMN